ncbi:MAG TPA: GNAT family N-acetyltransferase [Longimicrobium sp.]|nr:GNAT family N-acetyltransferase [Longimicrobium sp.]
MPDVLTLRGATPEDADAISALALSLARYFLADPDRPEDAAAFLERLAPAGIAEMLADARYRYHVALTDGVLSGVLGVRDGSHLYHLFVAEPFHGRGVAARLWDVASRDARARGNPGRFTVNSSRFAVPVYERFGFVAAGPEQVQDGIAFRPMERPESP